MVFRRLHGWFTSRSSAFAEYDGRGPSKVGIQPIEVTDEEKAARARNESKAKSATSYLTKRGRHALTSPDFHYVPAESTDIRETMRRYVMETMPDAKDAYRFLFV